MRARAGLRGDVVHDTRRGYGLRGRQLSMTSFALRNCSEEPTVSPRLNSLRVELVAESRRPSVIGPNGEFGTTHRCRVLLLRPAVEIVDVCTADFAEAVVDARSRSCMASCRCRSTDNLRMTSASSAVRTFFRPSGEASYVWPVVADTRA